VPSYWRVSPKFWTDPDMRRASDDARQLALYLLTCEHRTVHGLFRLPKAYICADLQWLPERLGKPFAELLENGFLDYDGDAEVLLIVNAMKYQAPENPNQVASVVRQLEDLPDNVLTSRFVGLAQRYCQRLAEGLPQGLPQPTTTTTATATATTNPSSNPDAIQVVFDAWLGSFPDATRRDLTGARRDAIKAALKRYPVEDVADATRGWVNDTWDDRPQHNDIPQLLHMGSQRKPQNVLEKMRDLWRNGPPTSPGRRTREMANNAAGLRQLLAEREPMEGDDHDDRPVGTARPTTQRELPGPAG
jgi:hypothetical protein